MRKALAVAAVLALSSCAMAEDEAYYVKAARDYVAKNSDKDKEAAWAKHWKQLCETAQQDNEDMVEEKYLDRYVYDWMADRKSRFDNDKLTVEDKIQACRLYLLYKDKSYKIPDGIQKYLTKENLDKFLDKKAETPK